MEKLKQIKFLENFENCSVYNNVKSEIYIVTKQNKKYFVKFTNEPVNPKLKKIFNEANIPSVKIISSGKIGSQYFIVEEFADYKTLLNYFDMLSTKDIYELGFRVSQNCFNLRNIYPDMPLPEESYQLLTTQILQTVIEFNSINNFQKLTTESQAFLFELRDYILKNINILKQSSLVFALPNVHPDNFLFEKPGSVLACDIENTDYHEITSTIMHSLCSDKENHIEKSIIFTQGYLEGLYQFDIPDNILKCCDYTFLYNAFFKAKSLQKCRKIYYYYSKIL